MKAWFIILLIIGALIFTATLVIDSVVENIINRQLAKAETVRGKVSNVQVQIWDAIVSGSDLEIYRRSDPDSLPFVRADTVVADLRWKPLFQRMLVGNVWAKNAELNYVSTTESSGGSQSSQTMDMSILLASAEDSASSSSGKGLQFTIDSLIVLQGKIHFTDYTTDPPLTASFTELRIDGGNISNRPQQSESLPASVKAEGKTTGNGKLRLEMEMDLLPNQPKITSDITIDQVNLPDLNDFFKAYAGINMNEGSLHLSSRIDVNEGAIDGYITPDLQNIKVVQLGQKSNAGEGLFNKTWEAIAGLGLQIVQNPDSGNQSLLGRIPIQQDFTQEDEDRSVFESIKQAVSQALDSEMDRQAKEGQPDSVGTN